MSRTTKRKRREFEVFSLAFLDCICCGLGAMVLLFVLTVSKADKISEHSKSELDAILQQKLAARNAAKASRDNLEAQVVAADQSLADLLQNLGDLDREIEALQLQLQNESGGKKDLLTDIDNLKREIAAMQRKPEIEQLDATTPIGVPVVSNYVAFVIDTSGSMRDPNTEALWAFVQRKFQEVLESYPAVKGIQFLDADGRFILGRSNGWIPDSPEARKNALQAVRRYQIYSNSNPVPGIVRAIRTLHKADDPDMKMGIYVFGDEFTETADSVIRDIDRLNAPDANGKRPVTINGLGFPTGAWAVVFGMGQTGLKFANLLRELAWRNGGAFIAVTDD
jgi:hypothetical protein